MAASPQAGLYADPNLASHGVGRSSREYPGEIATWPNRGDTRPINNGLIMTVEPFLSMGGLWATSGSDAWTLYSELAAAVVQYEHTLVAKDRGGDDRDTAGLIRRRPLRARSDVRRAMLNGRTADLTATRCRRTISAAFAKPP